jgi:hypothetical protein
MRRLFGVFLALAMALGLVTPALAAGTPEPGANFADGFYDIYDTAYDMGYVQGQKDAGGKFAVTEFYKESSAELWESGTYAEGQAAGKQEGYEDGYVDGFFQKDYDEGYKEGFAIGMADFKADNDYANEPEHLTRYDSKHYNAQNMYQIGLGDGYWDGVSEGEYKQYLEEQKKAGQERVAEKGGAVGQINVMLNGAMVAFPDAYPEMKNDRTMVPIRAIAEALGAKVEYLEGKVVQITQGDTVLNLTIGGDTVQAVIGGVTKDLKMDAVSYAKENRTYVPLRFVSEALGLEVHWDAAHRTVVLLDQAAIAAKLDGQFTVLNGFLARQTGLYETPKRIDSRFSLAVEVIDSINGNKTHTISGSMVSYVGDGAMTMDGTVDLTALTAMVKAFATRFEGEDSYSALLKAFAVKQGFSVKVTPEGQMYMKMPLLGQLMGMTGMEVQSGDVWYDLGKPYGSAVPGLNSQATMGSILAQSATVGMSYMEPFYYYDTIMTAGETTAALFGDTRFQKSGDTYTCTLTLDTMAELMELGEADKAELKAMFEAFSFTLKLNTNGEYSVQGKVKINLDQLMPGLGSGLNLDMSQTGSDRGDSGKLLLQLRNLMNITITGANDISSTTKKPDYKLPEGAVIVDLSTFQ